MTSSVEAVISRGWRSLRVVSFDLCPYVERSRIVLLEKGLEHEVTFIDLKNKPDWFLKISPMGKVPVLLVDERPVFESMVINELLEELHPEKAMMPKEPLERADARAWIVFCNDNLMMASFQAQLALSVPKAATVDLEPLKNALNKLENAIKGPYFLGKQFTLVDAVYAPFFRRWLAAETWQNTPLVKDLPKIAAYAQTLMAHPSVVKADPSEVGPRMRKILAERAAASK